MKFFERLRQSQKRKKSLLCVGLDPDPQAIMRTLNPGYPVGWPQNWAENLLATFCSDVVLETEEFASAYKPNHAFFARYGAEEALERTIKDCQFAGVPVILDAKRGDIGNTAQAYAEEAFVRYGADALTVNPYMGPDTVEPFLEHEGKGIIVLCRTSNPGGGVFQDLVLANGLKVYEQVALTMVELDARYGGGRIGLVVGATAPSELARVRELVGDMPLLVPGIGAQGGDVEATVKAGQTADGFGIVVNSSRGIIYAKSMKESARQIRDEINLYRNDPSA